MIVGHQNDRPSRKPPFEIKTACIGPRGGEIHHGESMRTDKEQIIAQGKPFDRPFDKYFDRPFR